MKSSQQHVVAHGNLLLDHQDPNPLTQGMGHGDCSLHPRSSGMFPSHSGNGSWRLFPSPQIQWDVPLSLREWVMEIVPFTPDPVGCSPLTQGMGHGDCSLHPRSSGMFPSHSGNGSWRLFPSPQIQWDVPLSLREWVMEIVLFTSDSVGCFPIIQGMGHGGCSLHPHLVPYSLDPVRTVKSLPA